MMSWGVAKRGRKNPGSPKGRSRNAVEPAAAASGNRKAGNRKLKRKRAREAAERTQGREERESFN